MGIDLIAPRPSEIANARQLIAISTRDVENWSRELRLIDQGITDDPGGFKGQRLDNLILDAQCVIGQQVSFLCGMPIARIEGARS